MEDFKSYFKFAFVRNPWERLLSWFLLLNKDSNQSNLQKDFKWFLEKDIVPMYCDDTYFHVNQLDYISNAQGNIIVDEIGCFENFHENVLQIMVNFGYSINDLLRSNQIISNECSWKSYYTCKTRGIVEELCYKDIEYFGYSF